MFADKCMSDAPQFSRGLLLGNARAQAANDADRDAAAAAAGIKRHYWVDRVRHIDVYPLRYLQRGIVELEVAREHTHDHGGLAVQAQRPAQDAWVRAHSRTPKCVREYDGGSAARLILIVRECAASGGGHA